MGFSAQAPPLHSDFCLCSACFSPAMQDVFFRVRSELSSQRSQVSYQDLYSHHVLINYVLHILKIMQLQQHLLFVKFVEG